MTVRSVDRDVSFLAIWTSLLVGPPVALATSLIVDDQRILRRLSLTAGLALAAGATLAALGIRLVPNPANGIALAVGYGCFCLLAFAAAQLVRKPLLRRITTGAALIATLPGYVLGTVGALGLVFIAGDIDAAPQRSENLPGGLVCETYTWGTAFTDSGEVVEIYRSWPLIPLRWRLAAVVVNYGNRDPDVTCAALLASHGGYAH